MTTVDTPHVAWRGAPDADAPLVGLLHGRGSSENGGYAWFANRGIGRPVAESLAETMAWFRTWLDDVAPAGGPVALAGFSGGTAFAGGLVLDDPNRYAGAAILYGSLPFEAGVPTTPAASPRLPVLITRGDADVVIPRDLLDRTWTYLHGDAGSTTTACATPAGTASPPPPSATSTAGSRHCWRIRRRRHDRVPTVRDRCRRAPPPRLRHRLAARRPRRHRAGPPNGSVSPAPSPCCPPRTRSRVRGLRRG